MSRASNAVRSRTPPARHGKTTLAGLLLRLLAWIGIPLAIAYGLLWWRIDAAIDEMAVRARTLADLRYSGTILGLNGDVIVRKPRLATIVGGDGPQFVLQAQRLVVHTPGLWWLARSAVAGMPKEIPGRIGVTLEGVREEGLEDANAGMFGLYSGGMPMESMGCDAPFWTRADLQAMGLPDSPTQLSVRLEQPRPDVAELRYVLQTPGIGQARSTVVFGLPSGASGADPAMFAMMTLNAFEWTFHDEGFVAARNGYCARKLGLDDKQFQQRHLDAANAALARVGLQAGVGVIDAYRRFASDGKQLVFRARPDRPVALMQLVGNDPLALLRQLDATVQAPGTSPMAVVFTRIARPASAGLAPAPAVRRPASQASAPPAAVVSAAGTAAVGDRLRFTDLAMHLGAHIQVRTTLGTTRRGRLLGYAPNGISLKLDPGEGGYTLSMPPETIAEIQLLAPAAGKPAARASTPGDASSSALAPDDSISNDPVSNDPMSNDSDANAQKN